MATPPSTLLEAVQYFSDPDRALALMVDVLWPAGVTRPTCGSTDTMVLRTRRVWKCKKDHPQRPVSIKAGTDREANPLGPAKGLPAVVLLATCKQRVSSDCA